MTEETKMEPVFDFCQRWFFSERLSAGRIRFTGPFESEEEAKICLNKSLAAGMTEEFHNLAIWSWEDEMEWRLSGKSLDDWWPRK